MYNEIPSHDLNAKIKSNDSSPPLSTNTLYWTLLCLHGAPLHLLLAVPVPLLLQELALLFRGQAAKLGITLLLLQFISGELALLSLFLFLDLTNLGNLLFACLLNAAERFGTEVCRSHKVVRETQEVLEERQSGGVVRLETKRKVDALAGSGVVKTEIR